MKKLSAIIVSTMLIVAMCFTTVNAAIGVVEYSGGMQGAVPGGFTATLKKDTQSNVQLITAVYNDETGECVNVKLSDVNNAGAGASISTPSTELLTLDGYTVKSFVWDGITETLTPYAAAQTANAIVLRASTVAGNATLNWKEYIKIDEKSSYKVLKNGNTVATLAADRSAYEVVGVNDGDVLRVLVVNANDEILAASNEVALAIEDLVEPTAPTEPTSAPKPVLQLRPQSTYSLNPSKLIFEGTEATAASARTYSEDKQIMLVGGNTLVKGATKDDNTAPNTFDRNWTITTAPDGSDALYTSSYKSGNTSKNGMIYVLFGDKFASAPNKTKVKIEYFDIGTGNISIKYIKGLTSEGKKDTGGTKNVALTNTQTWKTVEVDTYTVLIPNSTTAADFDIRIQSNGNDVYVRSITAEPEFQGYAEFVAGAQADRIDNDYVSCHKDYPFVKALGETLQKLETSVGEYNHYLTTAADTGFVYENIGGKVAIKSDKFIRKYGSGTEQQLSTGYLGFWIPEGFAPEDDNVRIEVDYYDNGNQLKMQYVNGVNTDNSNWTTSSKAATVGGSNEWKTAVFTLSDAEFNNVLDETQTVTIDGIGTFGKRSSLYKNAASIRFACTGPVYINSVRVMEQDYYDKKVEEYNAAYTAWETNEAAKNESYQKELETYNTAYAEWLGKTTDSTTNSDELYPNGVSMTFAENSYNANGMTLKDNVTGQDARSDSTFSYVTIDGKNCVSTLSYLGANGHDGDESNAARWVVTYLYLGVADDYIKGYADGCVDIEITYWDDSTDTVVLQYKNNKNELKTAVSEGTATNNWKTINFRLDDAYFNNNFNETYGTDFRLRMDTDKANPNQLKVCDIKVKNLSHRKLEEVKTGKPSVFVLGDSIATDYTTYASRPVCDIDTDNLGNERYGWGEKLPFNTEILNYAFPGATTASAEKRFVDVYNEIKKNDYVLISFGHNDSMTDDRHVDIDIYKANLNAVIEYVQRCGATAVVITSIPTLSGKNGSVEKEDTLIEPYREAALAVANAKGALTIDLGAKFKDVLDKTNDKEAYFSADKIQQANGEYIEQTKRVHLSELGAQTAAEIIADALKSSNAVRTLKKYIND